VTPPSPDAASPDAASPDASPATSPGGAACPEGRAAAFARVALVYAVAALVGAAALSWGPDEDPLTRTLVADLLATLVVYAASVAVRNTSVYDPYWSVAPPLILAGWALVPEADAGDPLRKLILLGGFGAWSLRLTLNWAVGWAGLGHEDWRYVAFRERLPGPLFEVVNLLGLHGFPTVMVFLGLMGPLLAWASPAPAGPAAWLGLGLMLAGAAIELVADVQQRRHRAGPSSGALLQTGLWSWSRHPNYFGELVVWWGAWVLAMDAGLGLWWTAAGPLAMTLMFVFVSIPLMERRQRERRPGFDAYAARTPALLPRPPREAPHA